MWAIELANELPEFVEVHASDVSDANFPQDHPPNVHLSIASVTSFPSEWSNKFDFINQRFLFGALLAIEWPVALSEIYRVLKPGGAVQLIEMDPRSPLPKSPVSAQISDALPKACEKLGLQVGIAETLVDEVRAAGFHVVVDDIRRMPLGKQWGEIGLQGTIAFAGAIRNMSGIMAKTGMSPSEEEFKQLADKLPQEWDQYGNYYACKVVCARKLS